MMVGLKEKKKTLGKSNKKHFVFDPLRCCKTSSSRNKRCLFVELNFLPNPDGPRRKFPCAPRELLKAFIVIQLVWHGRNGNGTGRMEEMCQNLRGKMTNREWRLISNPGHCRRNKWRINRQAENREWKLIGPILRLCLSAVSPGGGVLGGADKPCTKEKTISFTVKWICKIPDGIQISGGRRMRNELKKQSLK